MKRQRPGLAPFALLVLATGAGCAKPALEATREPISVEREQVSTATATVESIDQKTRMVTLRGSDGRTTTFRAGDEVRNLAQVKAGDQVVATYYEAIAAEVRKPTAEEQANPTAILEAAGRAPLGALPGAAGARVLRLVATITAIDTATDHVTLTGPEGRSLTLKARDPRNLALVKVGDPVVITYTEAVALSVTPAPSAPAAPAR